MRLDKLLSELKYGSRNEIKKAVKAKRVRVNNTFASNASMQIDPNKDQLFFDDERVIYYERLVLMMHKPSGFLSANYDKQDKVVMDLLEEPYNRFDLSIAGRLDKDAEGLLILTNDGALVHAIINPNKTIYKRYLVRTENPVENVEALLKPMEILDGNNTPYTPKTPKIIASNGCETVIEICEGKFHQVKRMFAFINHKVTYLKRIQINALALDESLELGQVRVLSEDEITQLIQKS